MSLVDKIRESVEAATDDDCVAIARSLLDAVDKRELLPLLIEEIRHEQRRIQRLTELRAFANVPFEVATRSNPSSSELQTAYTPDGLRALYKTPFALGDGTRVTWGRATVEQHEMRLAMLRRLRAGLDQTIARHNEALELLRTTGVKCLEDLAEAAA